MMRPFVELLFIVLPLLLAACGAYGSWRHYRRAGNPRWFSGMVAGVSFTICGAILLVFSAVVSSAWINRFPPALSAIGAVDGEIVSARLEQMDFHDMTKIFCAGKLAGTGAEERLVAALEVKPEAHPDVGFVNDPEAPAWWSPAAVATGKAYKGEDCQGTSEVQVRTWVLVAGDGVWIEKVEF